MPVLNFSKTQLTLACATGGSCIAGVPVALYLNQDKSTEKTQEVVSDKVKELNLSAANSGTPEVSDNTYLKKASELENSNIEKITKEVEELWHKIEEKYKENQTEVGRKNKGLGWGEEFKSILIQEKESQNKWNVLRQEWKDCKAIGGQDAYCGYLEIERGADKYRVKVDRYDTRNNNKEWDVFIIKAYGRQIKQYDMTRKEWEIKNHEINKFGGVNTMASNWWVKLTSSSILKNK